MDEFDYEKLFSLGFANLGTLIAFPILVFWNPWGSSFFLQILPCLLVYLGCWFGLNLLESVCRWFWRDELAQDDYLMPWLRSLPLQLICLSLFAQPQVGKYLLLAGLTGLVLAFGPQTRTFKDLPKRGLCLYFVCLFVVFVFTRPMFIGGDGYSEKIFIVKANMHTFQTMLESYFAEHRHFPPHLPELKQDGNKPGKEYWKEFTNPMTGMSGFGRSYREYPPAGILPPFLEGFGFRLYRQLSRPDQAGLVVYRYLNPKQYHIYGLDKTGNLIQNKGQTLVLTHN